MNRKAYQILRDLENRVARLESRKLAPEEIAGQIEVASHLSKVDPNLAKILISHGGRNKDKVSVSQVELLASSLRPSQTTMRLVDSVEIALKMLSGKTGTKLGAIISKDGYIMDGHHRWSASIIAFGQRAKVGGYQANLNGSMLIRVLNLLTKGYFGVRNGNKGDGSITSYTSENVRQVLEVLVVNGVTGKYPVPAQEVRQTLIDNFGSIERGIEVLSENVKHMKFNVAPFAPKRVDMPVIRSVQVPEVADMLSKGEVLWKPPYPEIWTI